MARLDRDIRFEALLCFLFYIIYLLTGIFLVKKIIQREITNIKRDVSTLQININSTIKGNKISLGQIQNEIDYNEGTQKINEYNYNYKISLEENKQKKIKADINKLNKEIKGMIEQTQQKDSFQNMKSKEVNNLNEEMIKFLSYLDN